MIGPIYVVTDPASAVPVIEQARAAARGGAWAVQLRDKQASDAELHALVRQLLPEMAALAVRLIVNDRVEVAISAGADGVHIGQGDGDPRAVRARLGSGRLVGLSVETLSQARRVPPGVDYIGAGPVRATATKPDHAPPVGLAGLAGIAAAAPVPVIAIGGLALGDAAALKQAGAVGMAVVSAVTRAADPEAATRALLLDWRQA
ncbi:thiamine-phosphate diphosphorylase [Gemmobacter megaterium]|uniref:Thiamine-phosphate synthase n=1 Tax=Gemmobacter megaterium TaxID=1086013 RepID=A0A1N7M4Q8_9RHOB|nr:thiamine phosphate synthase [Gemmobacter megaterium]GGE08905.1 thiamine-phosphate synthase [Gemmobacter megaterium]SIS81022.1 thiamine-phosphate diphosphorylase [Gemmobacter megaterium]